MIFAPACHKRGGEKSIIIWNKKIFTDIPQLLLLLFFLPTKSEMDFLPTQSHIDNVHNNISFVLLQRDIY